MGRRAGGGSALKARRPQSGKIESYEAVFIVVKEEFNESFLIKADPPFEKTRLFPVIKLNALHRYWTKKYPITIC